MVAYLREQRAAGSAGDAAPWRRSQRRASARRYSVVVLEQTQGSVALGTGFRAKRGGRILGPASEGTGPGRGPRRLQEGGAGPRVEPASRRPARQARGSKRDHTRVRLVPALAEARRRCHGRCASSSATSAPPASPDCVPLPRPGQPAGRGGVTTPPFRAPDSLRAGVEERAREAAGSARVAARVRAGRGTPCARGLVACRGPTLSVRSTER